MSEDRKGVSDWRAEAVVLFVRLPVVALFAMALYGAFELGKAALEDNAAHIAELTAVVQSCVTTAP